MVLTRERLEQLVARSPDIVVATDRKGTVIYYNDGAAKSLGYSGEELQGKFVGQLYASLDEAKRVMAAMRSPEHGGPGIVESFRTTLLARSGELIPVAISGTLIRDDRGEEDGTIGFCKDLREILRKEELATLGEVAIGLSHEVNNPLAVILNQAELLETEISRLADETDCSVEVERIDAIRREVARIAEILERLGQMVRDEVYETVDYVGPARMIDLRRRAPGETRDARLEGLRVLVADDDLGITGTLKEILERAGCRVSTASDGMEALQKLETEEFDAVVSDVVMPHMDGYELYQRIQQLRPGLPVLMMTAFHYDRDHVIKRARVAGLGTVIFKKPVDPERLRAALIEAVGKKAGA
jgi:PAS domain S-box-containing protein